MFAVFCANTVHCPYPLPPPPPPEKECDWTSARGGHKYEVRRENENGMWQEIQISFYHHGPLRTVRTVKRHAQNLWQFLLLLSHTLDVKLSRPYPKYAVCVENNTPKKSLCVGVDNKSKEMERLLDSSYGHEHLVKLPNGLLQQQTNYYVSDINKLARCHTEEGRDRDVNIPKWCYFVMQGEWMTDCLYLVLDLGVNNSTVAHWTNIWQDMRCVVWKD